VANQQDPLRVELARRWQALLEGSVTAEETSAWAEHLLDESNWAEEIVFQGLLHLQTVRPFEDADDPEQAREVEQRHYWDWQELAHWYDDDPQSWNRNYYRNFLRKLVSGAAPDRASRFAHSFSRHALLSDVDIQEVLESESRRT
jgi:hypothetical protein